MQQKEEHLDLLAKFLRTCPKSLTDVMVQNDTALHIALKFDNFEAFKLLVGWLGSCKVKFKQPSCWLYSVPNLLVF